MSLPIVTRQAMELFDSCYRAKNMIREFPETYRFIEQLWKEAASIRSTGMPDMPSVKASEAERLEAVNALEEWAISIAHGLECNPAEISEAIVQFLKALEKCETIETEESVWKRGPDKVYKLAVAASNLVDRAEIALRRERKGHLNNGNSETLHFIESLQHALSGVLLIRSDDDEPAGFVCHPNVEDQLRAALVKRPKDRVAGGVMASGSRLDVGKPLEDQAGPHITIKPTRSKKSPHEV